MPAALLEEDAFETMRVRLRAVSNAASPHLDPRALALRAVVVADRLGQPDLRSKIDSLGRAGVCEPKTIEDLRVAARALLYVLSKRGAPIDPGASATPARAEALEVKRAGIEALEALDDEEVRLWLDAFRLPSDDVSLVFDLRSMALLFEAHGGAMGYGGDPGRDARTARRCADALDGLLNAAAAQSEWTPWVAPAFTLALSLYQEGCRIGRFLANAAAVGLSFPSLASIARARRRRGPSSFSNEAMRRAPPPLPSVPEVEAELLEPEPEPAGVPELAHARSSPPRASLPPDSDRAPRESTRWSIELEVGLLSESNFYVGFTENLSESGVFVATYLVRPLGSLVEISLRLLGRDEPLKLRGKVRWVRLYSPTSDAGPGMGIHFETISEADRAEITKFLATRDPIFFAE